MEPDFKIEPVQWSDDFLIGIEFFDEQHEHIIELLDNLIEASNLSVQSQDVALVLTELVEATLSHFNDEEEFMHKHDFPNLPEHLRMHRDFVKRTTELQRQTENVDQPLPITLLKFLKDWLVAHILAEDKKYKEVLSNLA